MTKPRVVIVTGLSGAGLSTAIHTLQDNGFYCIDNLPIELLWDTIGLIEVGEIHAEAGYAFGMDIRSAQFAKKFPKIKKDLSMRVNLDVLFVRAEAEVLEERFGTARRRHPLFAIAPTLKGQILEEEKLFAPVAKAADGQIDTTHLNTRQLRNIIEHRYQEGGQQLRSLQLVLVSFGFKYGSIWPVELLNDVRFLPNPFFEESLKLKTGLDPEVQRFVMDSDESVDMFNKMNALYRFLLPKYIAEGRHFLRAAIGCTGGQHRSVTFVEKLSAALSKDPLPGVVVSVVHRDVDR